MTKTTFVMLVSALLVACSDKGGKADTGAGDGGADGGAGEFQLLPDFGATLTQKGCDSGVELGANNPGSTLGVKLNAFGQLEMACDDEKLTLVQSRPANAALRMVRGTNIRDEVCPPTDGTNDAVVEQEYTIVSGTIDVTVFANSDWCADPMSSTAWGNGTAVYKDIIVDSGDGTQVAMGPLTVGPVPFGAPGGGGGGG